MVVVTIEERDANRGPGEDARGGESAESTTDDDHMRTWRVGDLVT
jgi:hypothetical protein